MSGKRMTTQEYAERVRILTKGEYELIGEYKGSNEKITLKHIKCGNEYTVKVHTFATGRRCPHCNKQANKGTEKFKQEVLEKFKGEYEVIGEYKNARTKIKIKHLKCGYIFEAIPDKLLHNKKMCPQCLKKANSLKYCKTHERFLEEVFEKVGNEYTVLSKYIKNDVKIKMQHNECGNVFEVMPSHFISKNGTRCPHCNSSKGETRIRKYCENNNIKFKTQYKFKECKNKKELPFDFAFFNRDKLLCLVEYDGQQHFEAVECFGGKKAFQYRQKCDKIKNDFCIEKGIELIRISYKVENVEEYLENQLKQLNNR